MWGMFFLSQTESLLQFCRVFRNSINLLCITFSKAFDRTYSEDTSYDQMIIECQYTVSFIASYKCIPRKTASLRDRTHTHMCNIVIRGVILQSIQHCTDVGMSLLGLLTRGSHIRNPVGPHFGWIYYWPDYWLLLISWPSIINVPSLSLISDYFRLDSFC